MELDIVRDILSIEHHNIAVKIGLSREKKKSISLPLLGKAISFLNELSIERSGDSDRVIVTISAILWTYREQEWIGLKDFLMLIFSRIGFSPASQMLDDGYDRENQKFSAYGSYLDQVSITLYHAKNEVVVSKRKYILSNFQFSVWRKISDSRILGISAPTSAGKSFILALKTIQLLIEKEGDVVYVVPTISLVSQVTMDYRKLLNEHGIKNYELLNGVIHSKSKNDNNRIYILTQEKAISAFSQEECVFAELRMIIVDEIQNVERVCNEEDQRAKTLYDLIIDFRQNCKTDHVVISGPRIEKIGELGEALLGGSAEEEIENSSPVGSITYSISQEGKRKYFKQYSGLTDEPLTIEIDKSIVIPKPGSLYKENIHNYIADLISRLGPESINVIFSPKPDQACKTAIFLASRVPHVNNKDPKLSGLIKYLHATVHPKYDLTQALIAKIAYHHGKMPHHVRRVIERAIAEKLVTNIVCTTTLMQGVNLPAQNVIIRNPNLFLKATKSDPPKLTNYEIANLRGRAGRLLKDLLGRTYILEEEKFEKDDDYKLFSDTSKELSSGYGEVFSNYKKDILEDIQNSKIPSSDNQEYSFLLTYLRQTAIKYPEDFHERLKDVKIGLGKREIKKISDSISELSVPRDICIKNRYWDPLVLEHLWSIKDDINVPLAIDEPRIAKRLASLIQRMQVEAPHYAIKYFDIKNSVEGDHLDSVCFLAEKWLKEKPLREILSSSYYSKGDNINTAIDILQNKISYRLPMFLQPIFDMVAPDSSFLRFIEAGAYHPVTRKLIEYSIPRETAIYLRAEYLKDIKEKDGMSKIVSTIKGNVSKMDYWNRIQLEALF